MTREKALSEWGKGGKRLTKQIRAAAVACMTCEVEEYDKYLTGDVWGFEIEDSDGNHIDSCWGHFGLDYAREAATEAVPDEPCAVGGETMDEAMEETLS